MVLVSEARQWIPKGGTLLWRMEVRTDILWWESGKNGAGVLQPLLQLLGEDPRSSIRSGTWVGKLGLKTNAHCEMDRFDVDYPKSRSDVHLREIAPPARAQQ